MKKILIPLLVIVAIVSIAGNIVQKLHYTTQKPIARFADGSSVTKKEYLDQLEYLYGKATLTKLVYAKLVMSAAEKAGVMPTDGDVDKRIAEIERRTPSALAEAHRDPNKMKLYRADVAADLALENLRTKDIKVTPEQVKQFYTANPQLFAVPQQIKYSLIVAENSVAAGGAEDSLRQGISEDVLARQPQLHVAGIGGFSANLDRLAPNEKSAVQKFLLTGKPGDVTLIPAPHEKVYLVMKITSSNKTSVQPFSAVSVDAERYLKLTKAPSALDELSDVYTAAKPVFEGELYPTYFADITNYEENKVAAARMAKPSK